MSINNQAGLQPGGKKYLDTLEMPMSIIQRLIKDSFQDQNSNLIMNKESKAAYQ